jgi:hypothetical protein
MQQYGLSFGFREPYQVLRELPSQPDLAGMHANKSLLQWMQT